MRTIELPHRGGTSNILISSGSYASLRRHLEEAGLQKPYLVVSQPRILAALGRKPLDGLPIETLPDGERAKGWATLRTLLDRMIEQGLTRQSTVIALGGGVVGDVAGFAASVYLRGIAIVQVPTTLLAQVDSSVGGKTGVNHRAGKNLIGTFHQPRLVLVDPSLLSSLPEREYRSGLYEAIKYGVIRDEALFDSFEEHSRPIRSKDPVILEDLIYRCLRIKADVVLADEKEGDLRRILNFGHTLGHAIEAASGFRRIRHGEAVGHGMIGATRIALRSNRISTLEAERIEAGIRKIGKLPSIEKIPIRSITEAMQLDKKVQNGQVHFVLPIRVGEVEIRSGISLELVEAVIRELR